MRQSFLRHGEIDKYAMNVMTEIWRMKTDALRTVALKKASATQKMDVSRCPKLGQTGTYCSDGRFGDGELCHCGCGVIDHDCANACSRLHSSPAALPKTLLVSTP